MEKLPMSMIAKINALQRMNAEDIHREYDEIFPEIAKCRKCESLRSEVAYRLQERFYGIGLSQADHDKLNEVAKVEETKPRAELPISGTRLIRNYKGEDHEVTIRDDGKYEYRGMLYTSLSAIAKKITGTNWNGRIFFGLKK